LLFKGFAFAAVAGLALGKMKIMRTTIILYFASLLTFILLIQCTKCPSGELPTQSFTQVERSLIPYSKGDTLYFENTNNQTIYSAILTDLVSGYSKQHQPGYPNEHHCEGQYYWFESIHVRFEPNSFETYMVFTAAGIWPPTPKIKLGLSYVLTNKNTSLPYRGVYSVESDSIRKGWQKVLGFYNVIEIGPKSFYNVYKLQGDSTLKNKDGEYINVCYYAYQIGYVGFESNKGNIFYLKK